MLDPTTNGYFIDENKTPLSLLEMRERFAKAEFVTYIPANCRIKDINKIREKYVEANAYISKNLFYFYIDKYSTFGDKIVKLAFIPKNFSTKKLMKAGYLFKLNNLSDEIDNGETDQESWKEYYNKKLEEIDKLEEIINDLYSMIKAPI